ncbi:anti-sigma regulatory factor (Ser/Thr protein kinase) [Blastococcus colisei]|uniref:Anti-sigma regulatory factor (Ser/Thr protein kinase) n=1 Tax=Blastococcus colisei TaxID=1564162 RepID=A0A543PF10_9ACTN|nr:sensor histidine kinase [Blastococcus colisei]TQN42639.1 anti-sigma regulatory factor (Ser/Thr protein kinase) [Blastococcus colisei]
MTAVVDGPAAGFEHEALVYRGDDDLLTGLLAFVREGIGLGESVVVALPRPRLDLLGTALEDDAASVKFLDMAEIGRNPAQIIAVWDRLLQESTAAGRRLRGVGEPAFVGRRDVELLECRLHELLLNTAFDGGPSWRLLCPYDEVHLPRPVVRGALRTHPRAGTTAGRRTSPDYAPGEIADLFGAELPRPVDAVLRGSYGDGDVPATRRTVAQFARTVGLPEEKVEVLELAASELATNSIRHGGGTGTVAMWVAPAAAVVEFSDSGLVADPLIGRLMPSVEQEGGRGVFLVNQLCDLVQLRSSERGTTVRITTWL